MIHVDFPTAQSLAALGYTGECKYYNREGQLRDSKLADDYIPAPRLDDAAYFLRDRYGLVAIISPALSHEGWIATLWDKAEIANLMPECNNYATYNLALSAALDKAIETIRSKR